MVVIRSKYLWALCLAVGAGLVATQLVVPYNEDFALRVNDQTFAKTEIAPIVRKAMPAPATAVVDAIVDNELLFQFAQSQNKHRHDLQIRNRMIQLVLQDVERTVLPPTDQQVQQFYATNMTAFTQPQAVQFENCWARSVEAMATCTSPSAHQASTYYRQGDLARLYGPMFASNIVQWASQQPPSSYGKATTQHTSTVGVHKVRLLDYRSAQARMVTDTVRQRWLGRQKQLRTKALLQRLRQEATIEQRWP